jgi:hypothetical protein
MMVAMPGVVGVVRRLVSAVAVVTVVRVLHALAYPKEIPKKQQRDALAACVECVVGEGWGANEWVCFSAWVT